MNTIISNAASWRWMTLSLFLAVAVSEAAAEGRKHALLVGCTRYPLLEQQYKKAQLKSPRLYGSTNNVELTAELLTSERFGFQGGDIVTLVHENAEELQRPLRANIVREFERLTERVSAGDDVFVLLNGHGGQQPNQNPDEDDEYDGLDEVFLPEDVPEWKEGSPIGSAITDDQIGIWLDALVAKGAFVFFVADTCHSGSMSRGPEDEDESRKQAFLERVGEPIPVNPAPAKLDPTRHDSLEVKHHPPSPNKGGLMSLYAVPDRGTEREHPMPPPLKVGKSYARLTYVLNSILRRTNKPLTYAELGQHLRWEYQRYQWIPQPFVSGDNPDRVVLSQEEWPDRSEIILSKGRGNTLLIDAGLIQFLTVGSKLAVFPPAGDKDSDNERGYVVITEVTPTEAVVEPCEFKSQPAVALGDLPVPGRCEPVFRELGDARIAVEVRPLPELTADGKFATPSPSTADVDDIRRLLQRIASSEKSLCRLPHSDEQADLYLFVDHSRRVHVRRSTDPYDASPSAPIFHPLVINDALEKNLEHIITLAARATNLLELASTEMTVQETANRGQCPVDIEVSIEVKPSGGQFQTADSSCLKLHKLDQMRVTVKNLSTRVPVDVSVLYVESGYRIHSFLPHARQLAGEFDNRVLPGQPRVLKPITINDSTLGQEDLVILAVAGTDNLPRGFQFLTQDYSPIESNRSLAQGIPGTRGSEMSPLDQLVEDSLYRPSASRGVTTSTSNYALRRVTLTIEK